MAADNRSIVITLKLKTEESEASVDNQTDTEKVAAAGDNDSAKKAAYAGLAIRAAATLGNEVAGWAEYYYNQDLQLEDDYIGQRNKQIATTHINRAASSVGRIGSWTAQGAMAGGWVGAIVGFVIGTTFEVANVGHSNAKGRQQQEIQIRQLNAQMNYTRSRAGWSLQAASIGEDL